ncbi:MAG: Rrf2 family transcriptional regulator [Rhodobiaceae bacterium]|nr:Rrf2 family transcriptional regulator [Rhodobiaceae bacterium]
MHLTTFTDYSLRVLIYLGIKGEELATIGEIASAYGVSQNHLMKIVQNLAGMGYVETIRGKGGGLRLGALPEEINVGEVVRACERNMALVECFEPGTGCCIEKACLLKGLFREAGEAFLAVLEKYHLSDLLRTKGRLAASLGITAQDGPARASSRGEPARR